MSIKLVYIIGICFCIPAVYTDLKYHKIYNKLTFSGIVAACLLHGSLDGSSGVFFSLKGFVCGIALLIIPFALYVIGAGDVKLLAMIGAFSGWTVLIDIFVYFLVFAGICACIQITVNQRWKIFFNSLYTRTLFYKDLTNSSEKDQFKTGLALSFFLAQLTVYFLKYY